MILPAIFLGHGNSMNALSHNYYTQAWAKPSIEPYDWALSAEAKIRELVNKKEITSLIAYERLGFDVLLSVPTPEHYLPLLYIIAQHRADEQITFPVEGFDGSSVSMLSIKIA